MIVDATLYTIGDIYNFKLYEKDENRIKEIDKEIRNIIYYKNKDIKKSFIINNSYTKPNYVNKLYRVRKKTN